MRTDEHEALAASLCLLLIELEYGDLDTSGVVSRVTFDAVGLLQRIRLVFARLPKTHGDAIVESVAQGDGWLQPRW